VLDRPAASANIVLLVAVFLRIHSAHLDYPDVGASYDAVVRRGQVWRLLTSQLSHVSFLHLVLNVAGLWNVSNFAEGAADSGTAFYVGRSLLLLTLSAVGFVAIYAFSINVLRRSQDAHVTCVGYSCVLFGWMSYLAVTAGSNASFIVLGFAIPAHVYPWAALVFTSVVIPQASFVGHLAGILAGYATGWTAQLLSFWHCIVVFALFLVAVVASGSKQLYPQLQAQWQTWTSSATVAEGEEDMQLVRRQRLERLDSQPASPV